MLPRLFDFTTNLSNYFQSATVGQVTYSLPKFGKGEFTKITKPVEIKRNLQNDFTLYIEISQDDELASKVAPDMAILTTVKPENSYTQSSFQIFVIKNVKFENKRVQIAADHVKYMFFNNVIIGDNTGSEYLVRGDLRTVMSTILDPTNLFLPNQFTVNTPDPQLVPSDITVDIGANATRTLGDIFDNSENGILKQSGGWELAFDNFTISILRRLGNNQVMGTIRYGENLSECSMEMSNEKEYTHIIPYASVATTNKAVGNVPKYEGDVSSVTLYAESAPLPTLGTSQFIRILPVDFSRKFTSKNGYVNPNEPGQTNGYGAVRARLDTLGNNYIAKHPELKQSIVNIAVSNQKEIKDLNNLSIGDNVQVIYEPLKYEETHRVTEVNYNPVTNSYNSLTIGDRKFSLYDFISKMR